jgi:hypothetical protein
VSPHQAVAVAVRLFAVWLATYLIRTTPIFVITFGEHDDSGLLLASAIVTALGLIVAAALWFFPLTIARQILPTAAAHATPPQPPERWLAMGCFLIGLWILATSVSGLVQNGLALYSVDKSHGTEIPNGIKHGILYSLLNVVIAAALILGARGFVRIFRWAQNAGLNRPSN